MASVICNYDWRFLGHYIALLFLRRFKVDMTACPIIQRVAEECGKLEAFQKAHPYVQPDCPEDLKKQS